MNRREFIAFLSGVAAAWPLAARAQQAERVRRVGVLMAAAAGDPEYQGRVAAFLQSLQQLGWADSRNVRVDTRWATDPGDLRRHAAELVALAPDVIVAATGTTTIAPLLQATPHRAHRVRVGHRPCRRWFHREPVTTGWQRHRVHDV
jgi:putative tryptophan/tyrosine transport system substrate-binding protein